MKPASNAVREAFIEEIRQWYEPRLEGVKQMMAFYGQQMQEPYAMAFRQGFQDGIGVAIAATDSRKDNRAKYRIVDLNGDYIPFYASDYPESGEAVHDIDKDLGLIVSIFPNR